MNKIIKKKLIISSMIVVFSIVGFVYIIVNRNEFNEKLYSYLSGFICGLFAVGILTFFRTVIVMKNPKKTAEYENTMKDERLISINDKALAITFKITVLVEAIISIVGSFIGQTEISTYLSLGISIQLLMYVVIYFGINKKN